MQGVETMIARRELLELGLLVCMGLLAVKDILFLVMHILGELKQLLKTVGEVIQEAIQQWRRIQNKWSED
jgi:hypothetical protein